MTSQLNRWLLVLAVLVGVPFWWLLISNSPDNIRAKPVHISELRRLADAIPGPRPTALSFVTLGNRLVVGDLMAGGIGLERRPLAMVTWVLTVPGQGSILIDPDYAATTAGLGRFRNFNRARQTQVDALARHAGLILFTRRQITSLTAAPPIGGKAGAGPAPAVPSPSPTPATAQSVAPGVVVIPADSHAPGAEMIYVQLADGREWLFTGNIASFQENWTQLRARSRLASIMGPAQSRKETYAWLRTIRQLVAEAPKLTVVPGHDYNWVVKARIGGAVTELFADRK